MHREVLFHCQNPASIVNSPGSLLSSFGTPVRRRKNNLPREETFFSCSGSVVFFFFKTGFDDVDLMILSL